MLKLAYSPELGRINIPTILSIIFKYGFELINKMKNKKYCAGTVPKPSSKRGSRARGPIIHNWITVESGVKHHEPQTTAISKIVERGRIDAPGNDNVNHLNVLMSH